MGVSEKQARAEEANKVFEAIAAYGRQFFREGERVTRLDVDDRGRLWLTDRYRGDRIYVSDLKWDNRHFSEGGTMRAIVDELCVYIKTGRPMRAGHFGPWPEWLAGPGGDRWGYGVEEMDKVREAMRGLVAVATPAQLPAPTAA